MLDIIIFVAVLFIFVFTVFLVNMMVDMKNELEQMADLVNKIGHDVVIIKKWVINKGYKERYMEIDPMGYTE